MRKLLCLAMLVAGVASAEISITQPGGGGGGGSDPVAQAAAAAAQATANNAISNRGVQINGSYLTNGASITTGGLATNGNAIALTNFPALVVQTNQPNVNIGKTANFAFFDYGGDGTFGSITALTGGFNIVDRNGKAVLSFYDGTYGAGFNTRFLWDKNNNVVASFGNGDFFVGPQDLAECVLPVYRTLTNTAQQVTNLTTLVTTHTAQIATNTANITSNASPYQPWTATLTPPPSSGTNVLKFSDGALPFLSCTGAQTVAWIDGAANGWGTNGLNRQRLALWKGAWSVTIQSNASVVHASTITLSSTKTNHIVANITVGSGYTNVVLYPLTAQ